MNAASEDRIIDLWPTPFLYYTPDGHERYDRRLATLAEQAPDKDILIDKDEAAVWLARQIDDAVRTYLDRWAERTVESFTVSGRAVVRGYGDYRPLTNHPDAYLNGIYHVTAPGGMRDDHHRFDADSNALSFYDPRFAMNMGAIAHDPNIEMEKRVRPQPGVMIVWPSYVDYFIHPNLSAEAQISVHFTVVPEALE